MTRSTWLVTTMAVVAQAQPAQVLQGTVAEKVDAAGYSYVRVTTPKGEQWAAVPQVEVAKGASVVIEVQAFMKDFESKTLKRSWPVIAFGTLVSPAPSAAPSQAAPAMENPHAKGLPKTLSTPPLDGTVVERLDTGTYSYLRLKTGTGETWAAVPRAEVPNGMQVRIKNPQPMDGFSSPTLKRSFERIVFGTLELPAVAPAAPSAPAK